MSLCAGLAVGLIWGVRSYLRYEKLAGSIATVIFGAGLIFALCIAGLTLLAWFYNRRMKKIEDLPENGEVKR